MMHRRTLLASLLGGALPYGLLKAGATPEGLIRTLLYPPESKPTEVYAGQTSGKKVDHAPLNAVLKRFVTEQGRVRYAALKASPEDLERYLRILTDLEFDALSRDEKLATLLNAYNAFTLKLILEYHPVKSIQDIPPSRRWKDPRWNLGGTVLSLDELEHELLRKRFVEPRMHFALSCASLGCPPLRPAAWMPETLATDLDAHTRKVHSLPAHCRLDEKANILFLSAVYDWFAGDFVAASGSVLAFVKPYLSAQVQSVVETRSPALSFLTWDWALNDQK